MPLPVARSAALKCKSCREEDATLVAIVCHRPLSRRETLVPDTLSCLSRYVSLVYTALLTLANGVHTETNEKNGTRTRVIGLDNDLNSA